MQGSMQVYTEVYVGLCKSTQVYVGVYAGLCGCVSLFVLGYHWLSLATIDLVGDNRESEVWVIFWGLVTIISGQWSQNIEGASLFIHGYHWLTKATTDLVGDNVMDINCKELSSIYPVLISSSFDHVLLLSIRFM